jgi:adenosylcobyric acid synthase
MLGRVIRDPDHVESTQTETPGLALLPHETEFGPEKTTHQARARVLAGPGWMQALTGQDLTGYEIHMGSTSQEHAWLEITQRSGRPVNHLDGGVSENGRVWGCYLHGIFANPVLRRAWLASLGWQPDMALDSGAGDLDVAFDRLARQVTMALDMEKLNTILEEHQ